MLSRLDPSLKVFGALIILIVACLATLPCISSYQANATLRALQDGAQKERAYNLALSLLKDAETGQRGFLIGSDATCDLRLDGRLADAVLTFRAALARRSRFELDDGHD